LVSALLLIQSRQKSQLFFSIIVPKSPPYFNNDHVFPTKQTEISQCFCSKKPKVVLYTFFSAKNARSVLPKKEPRLDFEARLLQA